MSDSDDMRAAGYAMAAAAEKMHNAAGGIIHGAEVIRTAVAEQATALDRARRQSEEQIERFERFERAVELQALAALLVFASGAGAHDYAAKLGQRLDGLLSARGVL